MGFCFLQTPAGWWQPVPISVRYPLIQLLIDNPLLLLFVVAAIGYLVGRIKIGGVNLGVAAVLFVGIAAGALHPDLKLPEIIYILGLVLFVYTVGLSNGHAFFASFRGKGVRDNLVVVGILLFATLLTVGVHFILSLKATQTAGLFVGSLNNAAALAGVLEHIKGVAPQAARDQMLNEPTIAFSVTFPMGVIGTILAINLLRRLWQVGAGSEAKRKSGRGVPGQELINRSVRVTRPDASRETVHELIHNHAWDIIFGRVKRKGALLIVSGEDRLETGDLVSLVGTAETIESAVRHLGEADSERLDLDRSEFDYRRMFVSNPKVAGRLLRNLNLPQQHGALVTRLKRGDYEFIPHGDTALELGDRVRVVTRRENMESVSSFFGDSYRAVSEIDVLTFSFGLALGLFLGIIPIPLPGGIVVRLGFAGGPLIVALILGALGRTGSIVWSLPYSANQVLRQFGLILFLAGIGTRAGYSFISTLTQSSTLPIFLVGAAITFVTSFITLWIGYRLLKIPWALLIGMLAGVQTQPAVLSFALEQAGNDLPDIGYANVFPTALIAKILLAQVLLTIFL
jgi:putative transport protein